MSHKSILRYFNNSSTDRTCISSYLTDTELKSISPHAASAVGYAPEKSKSRKTLPGAALRSPQMKDMFNPP